MRLSQGEPSFCRLRARVDQKIGRLGEEWSKRVDVGEFVLWFCGLLKNWSLCDSYFKMYKFEWDFWVKFLNFVYL